MRNRTMLPPAYDGAQGIARFSAVPVEARGVATENETIRPGALKKTKQGPSN